MSKTLKDCAAQHAKAFTELRRDAVEIAAGLFEDAACAVRDLSDETLYEIIESDAEVQLRHAVSRAVDHAIAIARERAGFPQR